MIEGGHRVLIEADLAPTDCGGLKGPIRDGHRSVAYRFAALGGDDADQAFGAQVEDVFEGGEPGGHLVARVCFYHDLAEVYATVGAEFDLWYGRVVGRGRVVATVPDPT
jgi:hypothetical protein